MTEYKYFHNAESKTVYRVPETPELIEDLDKGGRLIGWHVAMDILITGPDKMLPDSISQHPTQYFENINNRYSDEKVVVRYFHQRHDPKFDEINKQQYNRLKTQYE